MRVAQCVSVAVSAISILVASSALATPIAYTGQVVHVADADTVRVVVRESCAAAACPAQGETLRVRLAEIDAPEGDQPYGDTATAALDARISGETIKLVQTDIDQYGRVVAQLVHHDIWINGWLVGQGYAWVYPQFADSPELFEWQDEAQQARRGLWGEENPIEPWLWRRQ